MTNLDQFVDACKKDSVLNRAAVVTYSSRTCVVESSQKGAIDQARDRAEDLGLEVEVKWRGGVGLCVVNTPDRKRWAVTGVALDRQTRKRVGKSRTEVIDSGTNPLFIGLDTPLAVEQKYESFWNDLNPHSREVVKVIDVREAK